MELIDKVPAFEAAVWEDGKIINKGGVALWSADFPPPAVGQTVKCRINNIGLVKVTGYCIEEGFLGVMAKPLNPPTWYIEQNGGNVEACVFGREIELIEGTAPEMTRAEKLRLIYRWTPSDYKGKAGEVWGPEYQGRKTVMVNRGGTCLVLLEDLTDAEIADKLPGAIRQEANRKEANRKAKAALAKAAKKSNAEA